jgi:hypothetical protein
MPWYELAKVVHFLGLIALFGFFVIYSRAGPRLREATEVQEVLVWLGLLERAQPMLPGGAAMLLLSGLAMAALRWRGPYPFVAVGLAAVLIIWVGAIVGRRHLRAMRRGVTGVRGPVPVELSREIRRPGPWVTHFALNGAALGTLYIMTTKPAWAVALGVVLGLAALLAGVAWSLARRERRGSTA